MQIRVPSRPRIEATRRAWPPAPKGQSTATSPGCGASSSTSSVASTGLCDMGMTTRLLLSASGARSGAERTAGGSLRMLIWGVWLRLAAMSPAPPCCKALGDLRRGGVELGLLPGPGLGVPDLEVLARADHDAGAGERGVLDQRPRDADPARRVERVVERAAVKAAAQAAGVLAERAVGRQEVVGEPLELLGRVYPHAGVEALGENDAV